MSIRLTVQLTIQDGKGAEFEAVAGPATARVRAEDEGCEAYDLYRSVDDPNRYVMVESWASEEHLEAHMTSEAMKGMGATAPFMAGGPVLHKYSD